MARLGDVCEIYAGQGAPQGADKYCSFIEGTPFVKAGDLLDLVSGKTEQEIQCVSDSVAKQHKLKLYPSGSILFAKSGVSCMKGYVYCTQMPCYVVSHLAVVIPKNIDNEYLTYYFQFHKPNSLIKDSAYPSISLQDISNMELNLPSLVEQKNIATNLKNVNKLISLQKQQLTKLDQLIKSRFIEMFGDPEYNEKNWSVLKLETLCSVGSSKRIYQKELSMEGVPFLRISDLVNRMDTGSTECELYIPEERYEELTSLGLVPVAGDILLTARGTLGRCYTITESDKFYFQDGMITWLYDFDKSLSTNYLTYLFAMSGFRKQIDGLQAGSTVAYLSISMTKKLDIMLPPIDMQKQFAEFVEQTDKLKLEVKKSLKKLETLKKSLMQQYFG